MAKIVPLVIRGAIVLLALLMLVSGPGLTMYRLECTSGNIDTDDDDDVLIDYCPTDFKVLIPVVDSQGHLEVDEEVGLEMVAGAGPQGLIMTLLILNCILALVSLASVFLQNNIIARISAILMVVFFLLMMVSIIATHGNTWDIIDGTMMDGYGGNYWIDDGDSSAFLEERTLHVENAGGNSEYTFTSQMGIGFILIIIAMIASLAAVFFNVEDYDWEDWDEEYDDDY